jgi:hypothetical protein
MKKLQTLYISPTLCFMLVIFFSCNSLAQTAIDPQGIDTVYMFTPGIGQTAGQAPEYFPKNIFGLPDTSARENIPVSAPTSVCSFGYLGEIIVGWKDAILIDGEGKDFTIFENPFYYGSNNERTFAEPATVSVSKDGITYVTFPVDSLSLEGFAGVTPVKGNASPFDPTQSGGDSFDLADINIDSIRFIKISDAANIILDNTSHPFFDPTVSGFDLDALVGLHLVSKPVSVQERTFLHPTARILDAQIHNNALNFTLHTQSTPAQSLTLRVFSIEGKHISTYSFQTPLSNSRFQAPFPHTTGHIVALEFELDGTIIHRQMICRQ